MRALSKLKKYQRISLELSPAVRVIMSVAISITCLFLENAWALGLLFAASAIYLLVEVKAALILKVYLLIAVMAALALLFILIIYQVMPAMQNSGRGMNIMAPFQRLAIMVNMVLAMAMNTSLAGLANTLNGIYLPGIIRLPLIVLIRFIPTFFNDMEQLREAIKIRFRGRGGLLFWIKRPALWSRIMFLPLVVRVIRSGDELAIASELKGLNAKTKFSDGGLRIACRDIMALGGLLLLIGFSLALQYWIQHA